MQVSGSQLKLISRGCSDVSPAIRKQAGRYRGDVWGDIRDMVEI